MLNMISVTVAGNLTADPEIRFTPSGRPVVNFTVAQTPRKLVDGEWKDGTTNWMRCDLWGPAAENFANSFSKGHRVIATGTLRTDEWTDEKTNEKRSMLKLTVDEVGASVQHATVKVSKASRNDGPPASDPWTGESATERTAPAASE
jgi:single-strand DNA-binding protein